MTCKHLLNGAPDCVFCHRDQLKHELSLAEEGLANYAQENEWLKTALEWCEGEAEKGEATCWHCSQVAWKTAEVLPESPEPQSADHIATRNSK